MHCKKCDKANILAADDATCIEKTTCDAITAEHRVHTRLLTQQQVVLNGVWRGFGRLKNLSSSGAEIELSGERHPDKGAAITLELLDGTKLMAVVIWRQGRSVGLEFDLKFADVSELLHHDHLGQNLFLSVIRYQKSRADQSA